MDFTISREELLAAIDKCQIATDKNHVTESFRMMTVSATKKTSIGLSAMGEFCSIDTVTKAEIKATGSFNVMPARLRDVVSSMPPGRVQFTMKGTRVTVKSMVSTRKATFESHTINPFRVDDPGESELWIEVNAQELLRALKCVKAACQWENGNPTTTLLIPTERGVDAYGCNGYLIALCQTSIRFEGVAKPMQVPAKAAEVLALMATYDAVVRLYADESRLFLENQDTLVSAALWGGDPSVNQHPHMIAILNDPENIRGPTFSLAQFAQGTKSVLALSGFAATSDKGSRGFQVHTVLGPDTCVVELEVSEANARDEFDVKEPGAQLEFYLSSKFLDQVLSSLTPYEHVQVLRASNCMLLRSQDIYYGIMEEVKK